MRTSIATVCLAGTLREKLAAIAEAGFDGIEIFEADFLAEAEGPREVGRMVRDHGLTIELFQPFRDLEGLPEPHRARAFARAERKFDVMEELGCPLMLICSNVSPHTLAGVDRAAGDMRELGERAAARGLRVGYEALAWGRHVADHRDAWEVVRRADHGSVGLVLDSFHTLARGIDPDTIRAIPGDRIAFVQLADAPAIAMDPLYLSRHFRSMPGEGDLEVAAFARAVAATGYAGPWSLEVFNDEFRGGSPGAVARDGHRSLLALMDDVRRAEPELALGAPAMPRRQRPLGVEFVEFAAQGAEAEALERTLGAMGFRRAGRHRRLAVTRWRQGGINVVVNTETEGFAYSSYLAHGTGVSDLALRVEDAAAAFARARALGAAPLEQAVGSGELVIPAVRGVGGSVLRFVDEASGLARVWDVEFEPVAEEGPDAGLDRIDHVALTMSHDEMLSWALFHTAILEMGKTPMVDVADPDGLVRSQAVEAPGGAVRITLNGAETHRTLAGGFLADSFKGAVQHVAFATDDLLVAAERMGPAGFQPLPIPGNYYDDLASRHDLDGEVLARLRAANVLYDRDEAGGEYLQLYGRPWGGGIFFEVVERRGGYAGYGAPNALFRIAAQKRLMRPKGMPRTRGVA